MQQPLSPELEKIFQDLSQRRQPPRARALEPLPVQPLKRRFTAVYKAVHIDFQRTGVVTRAQEWLLDNRHIVEEALESLQKHLPKRFLRQLPKIDGRANGSTHIEALASELMRLGQQPLDLVWLEKTVTHYQKRMPLTIGELWALPSAIGRVLLEQLVMAAEQVANNNNHDEISKGTDTIAESITSLRVLANCDWQAIFERLCVIEKMLAQDPAGDYAGMDFESRNNYRSRVEELARGSELTEVEVTQKILDRCETAEKPREQHVGYPLISGGWSMLADEINFKPSWRRRLLSACRRWPGPIYFSLITLLGLVPTAALTVFLHHLEKPLYIIVIGTVLTMIPLLGLAVAMVNGLITWVLPPRRLARMDFEQTIPERYRSVVAVPVLFGSAAEVDTVFETLEKNFLGNEEDQIVYVVLSDLADADEADQPGDQAILARARWHIEALNQRYCPEGTESRFLFLNRKRLWNASEHCWMGWERKRGKLMEFNQLLAGDGQTSYDTAFGDQHILQGVRYVITLDADTRMQPGSAKRMIGTLAHPLSRAVIDPNTGQLTHGYSIIQPRLEVDPETTRSTRFTHVFSGDVTLDLYTHAASDTYHDLFGHGIFTGKGIYDWNAIEQTLGNRIPDNTLLSHDLLEGIHGTVGLATDIVLLEQYPPTVIAFMRRAHRWVRGDWQLLPWLMPRVPLADGRKGPNPLRRIHRWKIIDNLRRSMLPPAVLALFLFAWSGVLIGPAWAWTLVIVILLGAPLISDLLVLITRCVTAPRYIGQFLRTAPSNLGRQLLFWLYNLILLPYQTVVMLDAILRTLWRILISRKNLLQWKAAAQVNQRFLNAKGVWTLWHELWVSPAFAVTAGILIAIFNPAALTAALPLLLLWALAPEWVRRVDRSLKLPSRALNPDDQRYLRLVGRRTWLFFDRFIGPDDCWLPPDNYQEEPRALLAHRTSPTNIGMALNAGLAAHDFGWMDSLSLLAWLRNITDTMARMQRYRGHWFNWYETQNLKPLNPTYVSSVDSGNLAAALLTQARGLDEFQRAPIGPVRFIRALGDSLKVLEHAVRALPDGGGDPQALTPLLDMLDELSRRVEKTELEGAWVELERWKNQTLTELVDAVVQLSENERVVISAETLAEFRIWVGELKRQVKRSRNQIQELWPWLARLAPLDQTTIADRFVEPFEQLRKLLMTDRALSDWPEVSRQAGAQIDQLIEQCKAFDAANTAGMVDFLLALQSDLQQGSQACQQLCRDAAELSRRADRWLLEMDFSFLYDSGRDLFHIGFDASSGINDPSYYDLIASESRLTSILAIAKGDVPSRHWLHLGRPFRRKRDHSVLMSWSATLFEYLMPSLYLRTPTNSLTDLGMKTAIRLHHQFCRTFGIGWGISESAYYQLDEAQQYQYRAFGIPGLGFRRDLGDRLVIAPYASIMALKFDADAVMSNLKLLQKERALGLYGFIEAVDYGPRAESATLRPRLVRAWMSHHQGMALLAINNALNGDIMVKRFHADPRIGSISMLLHERIPSTPPPIKTRHQAVPAAVAFASVGPITWPVKLRPTAPQYAVLSNGHYSSLINSDGGGGSFWQGMALTHWEADDTTNAYGHFIYIKDLDSGQWFSVGCDPDGADPETGKVDFGPHRVEIQCRKQQLLCRMSLGVSSRHDLEARKLNISNQTGQPRRLMVVSYAALALASAKEFRRHPAFARLFIESECLESEQTLIFRRRPRDASAKPVYLGHSIVTAPGLKSRFGWETERGAFLGRNGHTGRPTLLNGDIDGFRGSIGTILDPAIAAGVEISIGAYERIDLALLTGVNSSRRALLSMLDAYRSMSRVDWLFEQARMQSSQEFTNLMLKPEAARTAMQLLSAVLAPRPEWRNALSHPAEPLQSALWSRGISGDWPLILARVHNERSLETIKQLLQLHCVLTGRQIAIDLVLLDDPPGVYDQPIRDELRDLIESVQSRTQRNLLGHIRVLSARELTTGQRQALEAAAAVVIDTTQSSLADQFQAQSGRSLPPLVPVASEQHRPQTTSALRPPEDWDLHNGYGGFINNGRDYLIHLEPGRTTPAPWSNVLANPDFGCLVTESGTSCTWAGNSSEFRLTPWPNDPVSDLSGEVLYLRDEENGQFWSVTPQPCPAPGAHQIRHSPGLTEFTHHSHGLRQTLSIHVDAEQPVKLCRLSIHNEWSWTRRVTATYYVEWLLGNHRSDTRQHLRSELDHETLALLVRNTFDPNSAEDYAFISADRPLHGFTTNRNEFLGRGGSIHNPIALHRIGLDSQLQSGADDCAALQVHLDIPAGETSEVVFVIGHAQSRERALQLARHFANAGAATQSADQTTAALAQKFSTVQVRTPDADFDRMINYWLPYQTLNGRLIGRTGYYQSSGAFGFRDQLQDAMAMVWLNPALTRRQLITAAGRQFIEGDVLHWWHEAPLRGVRSRCSDDLLWLPFVTAYYVAATGDEAVLNESIGYLEGEPLPPETAERYTSYQPSGKVGTLYDHCCKAIDHAVRVGPHGLPTIGSGDWNDGFNQISTTGRGESVWLAWFLMRVVRDFTACCELKDDQDTADQYDQLYNTLSEVVEREGWDGEWYRRAYFDDGTPLGSHDNDECSIDLIAQAWAVLASDQPGQRARQAMDSALEHLVDEDARLIKLLTPPFDSGQKHPGYIKGYPPGIRENGAQYTHAATWAVWATARLNRGDQAMHLFRLLNPALHSVNREQADHYRREPYVLAGDVYSVGKNRGRGGWSWYTGASSWLYRAGLEAILGLNLHGDELSFNPCLPSDWNGFHVQLRRGASEYAIEVVRSTAGDIDHAAVQIKVDGEPISGQRLPLVDDGANHQVRVVFSG